MGVAKARTREGARVPRAQNRLVRYFRDTRSELRKVVWPSRREALNLTMVVLAVVVAMSLVLGLLDYIFAQAFALVIR